MRVDIENVKISEFIAFVTPLVCRILEDAFCILDVESEESGKGFDTVFCLKKDDKEVKFYLNNLLLEIATIDRDKTKI